VAALAAEQGQLGEGIAASVCVGDLLEGSHFTKAEEACELYWRLRYWPVSGGCPAHQGGGEQGPGGRGGGGRSEVLSGAVLESSDEFCWRLRALHHE
jgi:hypothetical protein